MADPEGNELCVLAPGSQFQARCPRLGAVNCDGTHELGVFWSRALGWPLVWDHEEETAIQHPGGAGPKVTWSGTPLMPRWGHERQHSTSNRRPVPRCPTPHRTSSNAAHDRSAPRTAARAPWPSPMSTATRSASLLGSDHVVRRQPYRKQASQSPATTEVCHGTPVPRRPASHAGSLRDPPVGRSPRSVAGDTFSDELLPGDRRRAQCVVPRGDLCGVGAGGHSVPALSALRTAVPASVHVAVRPRRRPRGIHPGRGILRRHTSVTVLHRSAPPRRATTTREELR